MTKMTVQEMDSSNGRVIFVGRVMAALIMELFRGSNYLKFEEGDCTDKCRPLYLESFQRRRLINAGQINVREGSIS